MAAAPDVGPNFTLIFTLIKPVQFKNAIVNQNTLNNKQN